MTLARDAAEPWRDTLLLPAAEPRPGLLYVDLRRITDADLERLLPRLAAARGLVFDLRGASDVSTGLLSHRRAHAARSANWQIPVVMLPDHREVKWMSTFWTIGLGGLPTSAARWFPRRRALPLLSETLLETVASHHWAEIVGEPSGGDNGQPRPGVPRPRLESLWSGQGLHPGLEDGRPFHGVGISPISAGPSHPAWGRGEG